MRPQGAEQGTQIPLSARLRAPSGQTPRAPALTKGGPHKGEAGEEPEGSHATASEGVGPASCGALFTTWGGREPSPPLPQPGRPEPTQRPLGLGCDGGNEGGPQTVSWARAAKGLPVDKTPSQLQPYRMHLSSQDAGVTWGRQGLSPEV